MKIGIIGAGAFGFAVAHRLAKTEANEVRVWAEVQSKVDEFYEKGSMDAVLDNHPLPRAVDVTTSMQECVEGQDMVFILCASPFVQSVCEQMKPFLGEGTKVAVGAKGSCPDGELPANAAMRILGVDVSMFAGPGFAVDILEDAPFGITFATTDDEAYDLALKAFAHDPSFKLDRATDVVGVDLCSCIKNAAALACGVLEGAGHPISTQCLLLQRVLADLGSMLSGIEGGSGDTPMTLAGVGDMVLTCFSPKSRNSTCGRLVGEFGYSSPEVQDYIAKTTVEGLSVVRCWGDMSAKIGVRSELIEAIQATFADGGGAHTLLEFLAR